MVHIISAQISLQRSIQIRIYVDITDKSQNSELLQNALKSQNVCKQTQRNIFMHYSKYLPFKITIKTKMN